MAQQTVGELLGECLAAAGVRRVFGGSVPGLDCIPVDDPALAALLADADGRTSCLGAAWMPGHRLRVGAAPGLEAMPMRVEDPAALPTAVARASRLDIPESAELLFPFSLDWPAPTGAEPLMPADPPGDLGTALAAARRHHPRVTVLAGPGVVRTGHVDKLRDLAETTGWGVVNTWGAKGVFSWDSPYHLGTAGLQERDFELAGFSEPDRLVLLTGGDPRESPRARWDHGADVELHPRFLGDLAARWDETPTEPAHPPLFTLMAEQIAPNYLRDERPWNPACAAYQLADTRPEGGLVAADPGPAGFWIARGFPTTELSSVIVPATKVKGFAVAAAIVAALDGRPAVAVCTHPVDPTSRALLELAEELDVGVTVQVWGALREDEEVVGRSRILGLPVDFALSKELFDIAGPIVAWQ